MPRIALWKLRAPYPSSSTNLINLDVMEFPWEGIRNCLESARGSGALDFLRDSIAYTYLYRLRAARRNTRVYLPRVIGREVRLIESRPLSCCSPNPGNVSRLCLARIFDFICIRDKGETDRSRGELSTAQPASLCANAVL